MAKILIFVLKYSINYVEIIKYKGGIKMAEINQESGVFGGISFENNINQSGFVENAGTIRNDNLPAKTGFWNKFKAFWLQDIDWNKEIKVELTPYQQKVVETKPGKEKIDKQASTPQKLSSYEAKETFRTRNRICRIR